MFSLFSVNESITADLDLDFGSNNFLLMFTLTAWSTYPLVFEMVAVDHLFPDIRD